MSLTNTPDVYVNDIKIPASDIDGEVQYHPAASRRDAMIKATEALVISELLRQRAMTLELIDKEQKVCPDAVIEQLIDIEVVTPKAGEQECERYFEVNRDKFCTSPLVEVKHILISSDPEDLQQREQSKELAQTLIAQLAESDNGFADLARQHSDCPSKEQGGNLGQVSSGQTVPEFEKALFKASEGLIHYPVESRYGHHVVFVARKVEGKALPYSMVKDEIAAYLDEKVQHKAIAQYIQHLADEAQIKGFNFVANDSPLMQ
ncbi:MULTISPECIES: peptidylprolyl isomerase [unclassified Pseudoalteromonas]|uniref:peptidylprolyl isomerase n=1 Tax=unclassified Pseudoalteromonas TaxID=194690 RepID=UPI000CF74D09|nr:MULTISPECIES: peptidylprolyl isomerase [unclassified Pseudoalteromonas]